MIATAGTRKILASEIVDINCELNVRLVIVFFVERSLAPWVYHDRSAISC